MTFDQSTLEAILWIVAIMLVLALGIICIECEMDE